MRINFRLLGILSLAFFIGGCNLDKNDDNAPQNGAISVSITPEATGNIPDSLSLEIRKASGDVVTSYSETAKIPSSGITLPIGEYEVSAVPTNKKKPLFDRPLYAGTSTTTVSSSSTSKVNINLKQTNFSIGVSYSDKFKAEATNYSTTITDPQGSLTFLSNESRLGYFAAGPLTIITNYTDSKGVKKTVDRTIAAADASIAPASKLMVYVNLPEENTAGNYTGYYQNASGKTGIELKEALTTIISTGYKTQTYGALYTAYKVGDIRPDGTGAIWDVYSDTPGTTPPYYFQPDQDRCGNYQKEGDCFNREHCIPQSWFKEASPMVSDYLHILPTDGKVNGMRNNWPFGEVGSASWTSKNGSKLGKAKSDLGTSSTVFEPIDAYKGDIARIYLYFVTRYAKELSKFEGNGEEIFDSKTSLGLDKWAINMFLRWSKNDPVSQKEIDRNKEAEAFQNNRNPYVDHPEFIDMIWGNSTIKVVSKAKGFKYIYMTAK
ncbi:endonuclease [uncultured Acetobacteroides sp.]|uniref:endonuclease n=1 Tax=uncultured Acetobacteroides sp. TaxID=1760811 RepID=UPI0029F5BF61|nr:endonuclease [uncultured Acetobacteroides sp.]